VSIIGKTEKTRSGLKGEKEKSDYAHRGGKGDCSWPTVGGESLPAEEKNSVAGGEAFENAKSVKLLETRGRHFRGDFGGEREGNIEGAKSVKQIYVL